MDAVLRRLKLKKGASQDTVARKRLQHDLFAFDKVSGSSLIYGHATKFGKPAF